MIAKAILIILMSPGNGSWATSVTNYESMDDCLLAKEALSTVLVEGASYTAWDVDKYIICKQVGS